MATIKAGTYRFKDDTTIPTTWSEQQINFVVHPNLANTVYTAQCTAMIYYGSAGYPLCYYAVSSTPEIPSDYGIDLPSAIPVYVYFGTSGETADWNNSFDATSIQTVTIPIDTDVSDEFYEWFTANAAEVAEETPAATITYNGSTIATLNGGQTATVKCAGKKMESDVVVEVAETPESFEPSGTINITENGEYAVYDYETAVVNVTSGGGLAINGIIEQYKVNAGATVNAGDFVEFVNNYGAGDFHTATTNYVSACKLDNYRVFVAYRDGGSSNNGMCVIMTFANGAVNVGTETSFANSSYSSPVISYISAVALTDNEVMVFCNESHDDFGFAAYLTINGTDISLMANVKFYTTGQVLHCSAVALSNSKVLLACISSTSSSYTGRVYLFGVENSSIQQYTSATFESSASSNNATYCSLTKLTKYAAFLSYKVGAAKNCNGVVIAVDENNTIAVGTKKTIVAGITYCSSVALSDNKVVVFYDNSAVVLQVSGTTLDQGTATAFLDISARVYASALSENKVLATYNGSAKVLNVDGMAISAGEEVVFYAKADGTSSGTYKSVIPFSETSALVVGAFETIGKYASLSIDGDTITVADASGTFVQPAHSRLHNVGVAATSGVEGETVDVYVVG